MKTIFEKNLIVEFAQIGKVIYKNRSYTLRVYDEIGGGKTLSFHMEAPDKSFEAVFDANTLEVIEWKHHRIKMKSIPKSVIEEIKQFFRSPAKFFPDMTNWRHFIGLWNEHNEKRIYDMDYLPPWWYPQ